MALALMGGVLLHGQTVQALDRLSDDLCGCIQRVDATAPDIKLDASVRRCLEDAVVYHPATVNALIRREKGEGTKAFHLGRSLGTLLDRDCPAFQVVKVRLQQIQTTGSLKMGRT
ncbi:MAG: hypothetical protein IT229_04950 [Flavobacteriales bacterium]|nr:hypothetical protein [Flavobacteriales bacterium]